MDFENLTSEDLIKKPPKKVVSQQKHTGIRIKMNNVNVYLAKKGLNDIEESDIVMTIEELIDAQRRIPGFIRSIKPKMYSLFMTREGILQPYVAVGDRVKYAKAIYMPTGTTMEDTFTVTKVEMSSLGNMSVFVASLDNGDATVLTNFLKKV